MKKMTCRSKTVYLQEGQTLTDWMRNELRDKLNSRNRAVHMADDIGVVNGTLHRFLHGGEAKGKFYDKVFNYLMK
jgi:hypothetical protein